MKLTSVSCGVLNFLTPKYSVKILFSFSLDSETHVLCGADTCSNNGVLFIKCFHLCSTCLYICGSARKTNTATRLQRINVNIKHILMSFHFHGFSLTTYSLLTSCTITYILCFEASQRNYSPSHKLEIAILLQGCHCPHCSSLEILGISEKYVHRPVYEAVYKVEYRFKQVTITKQNII